MACTSVGQPSNQSNLIIYPIWDGNKEDLIHVRGIKLLKGSQANGKQLLHKIQ